MGRGGKGRPRVAPSTRPGQHLPEYACIHTHTCTHTHTHSYMCTHFLGSLELADVNRMGGWLVPLYPLPTLSSEGVSCPQGRIDDTGVDRTDCWSNILCILAGWGSDLTLNPNSTAQWPCDLGRFPFLSNGNNESIFPKRKGGFNAYRQSS